MAKAKTVRVKEKTRTITIFGEIGTSAASDIIHALKDLDATEGLITIEINSSGGNVSDGLALYDVMTTCKNKIRTVGMGDVQSIALIVFLGGTIREALASVLFMNHKATVELESSFTVEDLLSEVKALKQSEDRCNKILEARTLKSARWWKKRSAENDHTFGYEEAVEYGIITKQEK